MIAKCSLKYLLAAVLCWATAAHAGFEYKPAPPPQAPESAPIIKPAAARAAPAVAPVVRDEEHAGSTAGAATPAKNEVKALVPAPAELVETIQPQDPTYELKAGDTLRTTFARWCGAIGWTLVWNAEMDYPVQANTTFPAGTGFKTVLRDTLAAYWNRPYALEGRIYKNNVLEITGSKR